MTSLTHPMRRPIAAGALLAAVALLGAGLSPVLAAEPSPLAPDATSATILIVSLDTLGTDATDDDVLLDGTTVTVHADDGDGAFDPAVDAVAFGPTAAAGGLLDTSQLASGRYWVLAAPPAGYEAPGPLLVELNTDGTMTCVWDDGGLAECQANDAGAEGLSWTMVLVRNAPIATPTATPTLAPTAAPTDPGAAPTGEVQEATGRPSVTLPPTDRVGAGVEPSAAPALSWVLVLLLSLCTLLVGAARSTRTAAERRPGPRRD